MNDLAGLVAFRPVVHAIDISVSEPKAFVMRMVLGFSRDTRDHWVAASHNCSGGRTQGEKHRLVKSFKVVSRKGLALDRHFYFARFLLEAHTLGFRGLVCLRGTTEERLNEPKARGEHPKQLPSHNDLLDDWC